MIQIHIFKKENGKEPFTEWLNSLSSKTKDRIFDRIFRLQKGNLGDFKYIQDGIYELRLFFGGGLRIYFGRDGETLILLLCGGDKGRQKKDIKLAIEYWRQYHEKDNK